MFQRLRPSPGGQSLLMVGLALLALAGMTLVTPLPTAPLLAMTAFAAGLACLVVAWQRRRAARYDLSRLWRDAPPAGEEPAGDPAPDEEASPYCGWCDEVYPPGTWRCARCGRELG